MPSVRSIALGFMVRTGSRDEASEQAGISHFLEHLLFKGTDRFSSREIDEAFDAMGAEVNAGTGKETTSVYSRFLDGHLERAFDVLQDMVLRPAYPDIDSERQVVIEEIAMYEDEPQDKVHDVLAGAVFGDHPSGGRSSAAPKWCPRCRCRRSRSGTTGAHVPGNIVVAAAGNLEHERIVGLVEGAFPGTGAVPAVASSPNGIAPSLRFHEETEQYHLCLGVRGSRVETSGASRCACSTRSSAVDLVAPLPGGAREAWTRLRRLLYASHYVDTGQVAVYVGTRPDNVGEAMDVIGNELRRVQDDGVSEDELERARETSRAARCSQWSQPSPA